MKSYVRNRWTIFYSFSYINCEKSKKNVENFELIEPILISKEYLYSVNNK